MLILGLNKTTLLDYPEHVAATIFTGGCNLRCPFCHNRDLVFARESIDAGIITPYSEDEILSFLKKGAAYSPAYALPAASQHCIRICLFSSPG